MSETAGMGAVLSVAGGFMDAYSYLCRGGVFANAQTGNILLLGINLAEGQWNHAIRYFIPVLAFFLGIFAAEMVRHLSKTLHWRQWILLLEIISFAAVSLMPQSLNWLANSVISLACGMQVESFRAIRGNSIATTMCIGNLRSGTENLFRFFTQRDAAFLKKTVLYYGVIACFAAGAVLGNFCVKAMGEKAILLCAAVLLLAFLLMFADKGDRNTISITGKL